MENGQRFLVAIRENENGDETVTEGWNHIEVINEHILKSPKMLSIYCVTYNHREYIVDALEGFINQETEYPYYVVIYDDASTDGTADIVRAYAKKYPDVIIAILSQKNTYHKNYRQLFAVEIKKKFLCGKYIALCEGDDFWIDKHKLQIQIDFLEENLDCVLTIHAAKKMNYVNGKMEEMTPFLEGYVKAEQIILETDCIIPTASAIGRKNVMLPDEKFPEVGIIGDKRIWLYALVHGKIYFFEKIMSVYRYLHLGSWTYQSQFDAYSRILNNMKLADFFLRFDVYSQRKYHEPTIMKAKKYCYESVLINDRLTWEDFNFYIFQIEKSNEVQNKFLLSEVNRIFRLIHDENYLGEDIIESIEKWEKIFVLGAGDFAKKIVSKLERRNINIEGYIISDNQLCEEKRIYNKPVYYLKDIKIALKDALVIIAVNGMHEVDIKKAVKGLDMICCTPYWIEGE